MAVGRPDRLATRVRHELRLPHPGCAPASAGGRRARVGPGGHDGRLGQENGFTQTPLLWTPASATAYSDARARIIAEGRRPRDRDRRGPARSSRPSSSASRRPVPRREPPHCSRDDRLSNAAWQTVAGSVGPARTEPVRPGAAMPVGSPRRVAVAAPRRPPEQQPVVLGLRRPVRASGSPSSSSSRSCGASCSACSRRATRCRRPSSSACATTATCSPTRRSARAC